MSKLIPTNRSSSLTGPYHDVVGSFLENASSRWPNLASFKMDVKEEEKAYKIEAELAGIAKDAIEVDFAGDVLTISVKQQEEIEKKEQGYLHKERTRSAMQRSVHLVGATGKDIEATLEAGLLSITVPKTETETPTTQIEIK